MAEESNALVRAVQDALQVELDQESDGWTLKNPSNLKVGTVLQDVAKALSLPPPTLPTLLADLDLEALSVKRTSGEGASTALCCEFALTVAGKSLDITLRFDTAGELGGTVAISGQAFTLDLKESGVGGEARDRLVASYTAEEGVHFGADDFAAAGGLLNGAGASLKDAMFAVFGGGAEGTRYLVGVGLNTSISADLSKLPALGSLLPSPIGLTELNVYASSGALTAEDLDGVEGFEVPARPGPPPVLLSPGINVRAKLRIGDETKLLPPVDEGEAAKPSEPNPAAPASDGAKWLELNRSFGPLSLERVGVGYRDEHLWLLFDASFQVGILSLAAEGLGIGGSLNTVDFKFKIHGLSLDYQNGPISIRGGFVANEDMDTFDGEARIDAGIFSVSAIGEYSHKDDVTSAYVFAALNATLGGPAFFVVEGLAAGFGYHSRVELPEINEIRDHVLIQAITASEPGDDAAAPLLAAMQRGKDIVRDPHECWFAAGLTFGSFELLKTNAIFVVDFGHELEIGVLGLSRAQIPPAPEPVALAVVELALAMKILPDEGEVGASAVLTPASFVLDPACKLTGGFALNVWFGDNPHAGQFVLTVGGYHPQFVPPPFYPVVPRLGFHWTPELPGGDITIEGGAYFALTPGAVMAGGKLSAVAQLGPIRAWFIAFMDALITWAPFHFNVDFGISIGVSVKLLFFTLKIELGCTLYLWGPPVGGRAHVSYYLISFTIPFGADEQSKDATMPWDDFADRLLPKPAEMLRARVSGGLISQKDGVEVVRKDAARFSISTAIPANTLSPGGLSLGEPVQVRPVGGELSASTLTITIRNVDPTDTTAYEQHFTVEPISDSVPAATWGAPLGSAKLSVSDADALVTGLYTGCTLQVNTQPDLGSALELPVETALLPENVDGSAAPDRVQSPASGPAAPVVRDRATVLAAVNAAVRAGAAARAAALQALGAWSPQPGAAGFSDDPFAGDAGRCINGAPLSPA